MILPERCEKAKNEALFCLESQWVDGKMTYHLGLHFCPGAVAPVAAVVVGGTGSTGAAGASSGVLGPPGVQPTVRRHYRPQRLCRKKTSLKQPFSLISIPLSLLGIGLTDAQLWVFTFAGSPSGWAFSWRGWTRRAAATEHAKRSLERVLCFLLLLLILFSKFAKSLDDLWYQILILFPVNV